MVTRIALTIVAGLVVLAGVIIGMAAIKPDSFQVSRSTTINAAPEKIFFLLNDFNNFTAWSPYEKKDPNMKRTISGAPSGEGAIYAWDGDETVGKGRLEIVDSVPPQKVEMTLDFERPFETRNMVLFTLEPKDGGTGVTWSMRGPAPFASKLMQIFYDMDEMVGAEFETGLANLTTLAESTNTPAEQQVQ